MHDRPHEDARGEIHTGGIRLRLGGLGNRQRLPGEHRFVALEGVDLEQPHIGRDDIADAQADNVTRYQRDRVDELVQPIAPDEGTVMDLPVQRLNGAFRPILVDEAQKHAHRDDGGDDDRVGRITREPRNGCAAEQQQQERIAELAQQDASGGDAVLSEDVGASGLEPRCCLRCTETLVTRAQCVQHRHGRQTCSHGEVHGIGGDADTP